MPIKEKLMKVKLINDDSLDPFCGSKNRTKKTIMRRRGKKKKLERAEAQLISIYFKI